jgi:hypothetical protein
MKVKCPHCKKEHELEYRARIPADQKMSILIKSESECIAADALGLLLTNTTKALQSVAKNIGGKVAVFVQDITVSSKEVKCDIFLTSVQPTKKKQSGS